MKTIKKFSGASKSQRLPASSLLNCRTSSNLVRQPLFKRVQFRVPREVQTMLITFPAVRAEIEFEYRVANVLAARALIANGFSLNLAARSLGLSSSSLSVWLRAFAESGPAALRPKIRRRTADTCTLSIRLARKIISATGPNKAGLLQPSNAGLHRSRLVAGKITKKHECRN